MTSDIAVLVDAFDRLAAVGFEVGPEWQAVHAICQNHEGESMYDWGHAFCHRIEGDDWNAGYWYRRAGKPMASGSFVHEWAVMRRNISA